MYIVNKLKCDNNHQISMSKKRTPITNTLKYFTFKQHSGTARRTTEQIKTKKKHSIEIATSFEPKKILKRTKHIQ